MKIKIDDEWFDSKDHNVVVVFEPQELDLVKSIDESKNPKRRFISGEFKTAKEAFEWADK